MAGRRPAVRGEDGSGDEEFVRTLLDAHGRAMIACATRLTGDRVLAEDIVQEAVVRAWRQGRHIDESRGSVRAYLLTTVANLVKDTLRARGSRPPEVAQDPAVAAATHPDRDHADQVVDSLTVIGAMDVLSEDHRAVVEHLYLRERTLEETSELLGVPRGTVKSRAHYALRRLRDHLRETTSGSELQGATR
jgi:RNA polymerase sigma-70 factor, ECF subfamily